MGQLRLFCLAFFIYCFMTAPTLYGTQSWSDTSNSGTTSVPVPTSLANLDRWFAAIISDPTSQIFTYPAGWNEEWNDQAFQSSATYSLADKVASSSESAASVTVLVSERQAGVTFGVSGAASGYHVKGTNATGSSSTATIPGLTTTVNDCLVIGIVFTDVSAGDTAPPTTLTGWTHVATKFQTSGGLVAVYQRTQASAGSISDTSVTLAFSEQWAGISFALAPVGGSTYNLTANAAITTATSSPVLAVSRSVAVAAAVASATSSPVLSVSRSLAANANAATSISAPLLAVTRSMVVNANIASFISAPTGIYYLNLTANASVATNVSAPALAVQRSLIADVGIVSFISAPAFLGSILFAANAAIASNVSAPSLTVERRMAVSANAASELSAPVLSVTRPLIVDSGVVSQISQPVLAVTRSLIANAAIASNISAANLGMFYRMAVTIDITSDISAPSLSVLRRMAVLAAIESLISAPLLLLIEREVSIEVQVAWGVKIPLVRWEQAVRNRFQE